MTAYYNDNDPACAQWLRNLIAAGKLPIGDVDDRSIADVRPNDLRGYTQCHFFAGIGGWPLALQLAGWPATRPVWTGSCPCQPFSVAGRRAGEADKRHLWPEFRRLIAECKPATVVGEQVAGAAGRTWLAGVRTDMAALGYAVGAADLCAAGIGAPHIRQRLFWVADANYTERRALGIAGQDGCDGADGERQETHSELGARGEIRGLVDSDQEGRSESEGSEESTQQPGNGAIGDHGNGLEHTAGSGAWDNYRWVECADPL